MKFAQTCFFCQQPLTWGYNSLVWPYAYQTWIVGGIFQTLWIFYQDLVHHPDHWASVRGILFLEGAWSDTFDFRFHWILRRCPKWTTWGTGASVVPQSPWVYNSCLIGASLVFPGFHPVSFACFGFFVGGSSPSSIVILGHSCLAYPWCSLAHFLSAFSSLSFFGAIIFAGIYPWPCKPLGLGLFVLCRLVSSPS